MPEPVQAEVKLTRIDWQTNRVEEADEADNFRSEPLMQLVGSVADHHRQARAERQQMGTRGAGQKGHQLQGRETGALSHLRRGARCRRARRDHDVHRVRLTVRISSPGITATGRKWNSSPTSPNIARAKWRRSSSRRRFGGPALVTIERESVRRHFFTTLEGNAPAIKVPIEEADAPNVFVSVMALRGAQDSPKKFKAPEYRVGYTQLKVARPDAKLYVNVKASKPQVQPREEVTLLCEVRDVDGKPVPGAEVTLWAADEGVLSLTGFETPDPLAYFSKLLRLDVTTGLTLDKLLGEDPDERAFENKGYLVGGVGKGMEGEVRRNFLGTAYWAGALKTDAEGNVSAKFIAPDGLTRYRIMAVVQTKRDQFGHSESAFEINKPLMLEPSPPRFANVGDQMLIRAVLHNTTGQAGEAVVQVKLDGTATMAETEQKIALPANGSVALDFPVEFVDTGEARWVWQANFAAGGALLQDSVESRFKVVYPTPLLREIRQARVDAADTDLLAGIDPTLLQGKGTVRVGIANSRIFELREGVSELLHYPYGCVEQTTSAMLPWLTLRDFRTVLPELNQRRNRSSARWKKASPASSACRPATAASPIGRADRPPISGAAPTARSAWRWRRKPASRCPEGDFNRLKEYLSKQLRGAADSNDKWELSARTFACYALALAELPESAYHEVLFKKRNLLTQETRAFLALAVLESKGPQAMADTLLKMKDKPVEEDQWFGSTARAQGVRLLAWTKLAPKSDATMVIANALFELRKGGHWQTTQSNVWAVMGLAEYIRRSEADRKLVKGAVVDDIGRADFQLAAKGRLFRKGITPSRRRCAEAREPRQGPTLHAGQSRGPAQDADHAAAGPRLRDFAPLPKDQRRRQPRRTRRTAGRRPRAGHAQLQLACPRHLRRHR